MTTAASDDEKGKGSLSNDKLVVLAAYLAGAAVEHADTEDIAVQAAKLAPGRFSWRKYPDQINIDTVRKRLWDAASEKKGHLLTGSERDGWLLTETGLKFCDEHATRLNAVDNLIVRQSRKEQLWTSRERARMVTEIAYQKWQAGSPEHILPVEAERFFRIDDYVVGTLRRTRIVKARETFASDQQLLNAIDAIAKKVRDRE